MSSARPVRASATPPRGLGRLRHECLVRDGTDPFQHTPPFHVGADVEDAVLLAVEGSSGLDAFGGLWDRDLPQATLCVAPEARRKGLGSLLGEAILDLARARGAVETAAWVAGADAGTDRFCDSWQGSVDRRLFKLAVALPVEHAIGLPPGYELKTFEEKDTDALVAVNAAAFADHPDQAGMTAADVHAKMREDWFDPAGVLLARRGDELAAFCWTKVHAEAEPAEGEIHLICTSPNHQGAGLGRDITLAGLDHLAGVTRKGILYVDETNTPARAMYRRMGFRIERIDSQYRFRIGS